MQRVVRRTGSVLALALLATTGASLGAFAEDAGADALQLTLDASSLVRMDGLVDLDCSAHHAAVTADLRSPARLSGAEGLLRTIVVHENRTATPAGLPDRDDPTVDISTHTRSLAGPVYHLVPGKEARIWIYPGTAPFSDAGPFSMHATATRLTGGGPATDRPTPEYHWSEPDENGLWDLGAPIDDRVTLPVRPIVVDDATVSFSGTMRIRLQDMALHAADGMIAPAVPHRTTTSTELGPIVTRETTRVVDRWLVLEAGRLDVTAPQVRADCGAMEGQLIGEATWLRADGSIQSGDERLPFADRALTLAGVLGFGESVRTAADGPVAESQVGGDAQTTVVGVDFRVVSGERMSQGERAAFFTVVGAVLVWALVEWFPRGALFGYSRIETHQVLEHPQRAALAGFVRNNPGTSLLQAAEGLGSNRSVLRHHLARLIDHGIVRRVRVDRRPVLVPGDWGTAEARRELLLQKPTVAYILRLCGENGVSRPVLARNIRERFSISDTAARKWIGKCHDHGLIQRDERAGEVSFCRA